MPKNIERMILTECRICYRKLIDNKEKYCSDNCKSQDYQIRQKYEELKKNNPTLGAIFWSKKDNPNGELEWRKIKGVQDKTGKIIKNIVTKKKPKSR